MQHYPSQLTLARQESELCEFVIAVPLPRFLRRKVKQFKSEFNEYFGTSSARSSKDQITICDFLIFDHRTKDAFSLLKSRLDSLYPFNITIDGFDSFEGSNSIHLNINKGYEFSVLLNEIDATRRMLQLRKNYFQSDSPHITIAKNINSEILPEAKDVFFKREFEASFEVTKLEVLSFDFITRQYSHAGYLPLNGR